MKNWLENRRYKFFFFWLYQNHRKVFRIVEHLPMNTKPLPAK